VEEEDVIIINSATKMMTLILLAAVALGLVWVIYSYLRTYKRTGKMPLTVLSKDYIKSYLPIDQKFGLVVVIIAAILLLINVL